MRSRSGRFGAIVALLGSSIVACGAEEVRDLSWFLQRLRAVEHLPELEDSHTAMASTWDRTGGNKDGADFKDLRPATDGQPARNVLLERDGPGCIHRIFLGVLGPQQAGTRIQIFIDHADRPVFDLPLTEFFDYEHGPLPYPLVFFKSYPGTLFPIPYARHCRVQLVHEAFGTPAWDPGAWSNYWQITYTTYPDGTPVRSLSWPLSERERGELAQTCAAWLRAEGNPPDAPATWSHERSATLAPQQVLSLDLGGAGVVRQLRVHVDPATPEVLTQLRLQIAWDGSAQPSVDAPVGYFFGHAFGGYGIDHKSAAAVHAKSGPIHPDNWDLVDYNSRYQSLLLGLTESEAYSCFPMPFAAGATLRVINTGSVPVNAVRLRLAVEPHDSLPANWGRFCATWKQNRAADAGVPRVGPLGVPVQPVLERAGAGKYVGVMLSIDWPSYAWWGEGDWLIWSDQQGWPPDYHGTGSEEYFNSGWCRFDRKAISGFVTLRPGHPTVYSFHLNDAFQFQRSIRVLEEMMGDRFIDDAHPLWTTTAFWYSQSAAPAGSNQAGPD